MEKEKYNHKNWYHEKLAVESREMRLVFADELSTLIKNRWENKRSLHGVKVLAAASAGLGNNSWDPSAAYNARRTGASRFLKSEIVIKRLEENGIIIDRGSKGGFRKK